MSKHDPNLKDGRPRSPARTLGCLSLVLVLAIGISLVLVEMISLHRMVTKYQQSFANWVQLEGTEINEPDPLTEQTFVFGNDITLHGSTADIAILGGDATLHGHYQGNVDFLGRHFDLAPDAQIGGNLTLHGARHSTIRGVVDGQTQGHSDRLFKHQSNQLETQTADTP